MGRGAPRADAFPGLDVATTFADRRFASVRVHGVLSPRTTPVLLSVLGTHVRVGRRHLRVDLRGARIADASALGRLETVRASLAELDGLLEVIGAELPSAESPDLRVSSS